MSTSFTAKAPEGDEEMAVGGLGIELTELTKADGPLTKRISLGPDGKIVSNGSACTMARGTARRMSVNDLDSVAKFISNLKPNQAIAAGALRHDLPDECQVITKDALDALPGGRPPNVISRSREFIDYRKDTTALALLDTDLKGMPQVVKDRVEALGGLLNAILTAAPALRAAGLVIRKSTSTGLSNIKTGEEYLGSGGLHIYIPIRDGSDVYRFIPLLHQLMCLAGLGWMIVGKTGQLFERSLVDRCVGCGERLIFEGRPVVLPPLQQDQEARKPVVVHGEVLDSRALFPDPTADQIAALSAIMAAERDRLAPDAAKVRSQFVDEQVKRIVKRTGCTAESARGTVRRQIGGCLTDDIVLPFDQREFRNVTVDDVFHDPERYVGATMADPIEGPGYGRGVAKLYRRRDGTLWINSFAHGGAKYELRRASEPDPAPDVPADPRDVEPPDAIDPEDRLKWDSEAIEAALRAAKTSEVADLFVDLMLDADLDEAERERIRNVAAKITGTNRGTLQRRFEEAAERRYWQRAKAERRRRASGTVPEGPQEGHDEAAGGRAESTPDADARMPMADDPRPQIQLRAGELHTTTTEAEDALIASGLPIFQRGPSLVRPIVREVPASHGRMTRAAGLAELTLHSMTDVMCRTGNWVRYDGRTRALVKANPSSQVAQILLDRQGQWRFPTIAGVITTPTLRPDGSLLTEYGYDQTTRLYYVADPNLKLHQAVQNPTRRAALGALAALEGLLAEFPFVKQGDKEVSKSVALSALITPVVRGAMPVAPLHAFNAPSPGSGKSYLVDTVSMIATGRLCPVISVAADEAETEKRIAGLLLAGYPLISIDNVNGELGGDLLCQATERPLLRIRPLGTSNIIEIESCASIYATGNNLRLRGDMVRRVLRGDLDAKLERPELRTFKASPTAMVQADRGRYVSAALVIVRAYLVAGMPGKLDPIASFEPWSDLVRSAIVWLGRADPVESMERARETDPVLVELREVMGAWKSVVGEGLDFAETAREVAARVSNKTESKAGEPTDYAHPELRDALMSIVGARGTIDTRRLGNWLSTHEGRIVGDLKFKRHSTPDRTGAVRWAVVRADAS